MRKLAQRLSQQLQVTKPVRPPDFSLVFFLVGQTALRNVQLIAWTLLLHIILLWLLSCIYLNIKLYTCLNSS